MSKLHPEPLAVTRPGPHWMVIGGLERLVPGWLGLALAVTVALCPVATVVAQETIFDPENPTLRPRSIDERDEQSDPEAGEETGDETGDETADDGRPVWGPETIFDSQNPTLRQPETISDPENPARSEPETIIDPENPTQFTLPQYDLSVTDTAPAILNRSLFVATVRSRLYLDTINETPDEDVFLFHNRLDLRAKVDFSPNWTAVVEGRLEHRWWGQGNPEGPYLLFNGEQDQALFEATVRDAYVSAHLDNVFLTVGNQNIVWGAGTLTAPGDVINPFDYRLGSFDNPADQRIPTFAAVVTAVFDRIGLSAVLVPFFEPHKIDLFGTDFAVFRPGGLAARSYPFIAEFATLLDPSIVPRTQDDLIVTEFPEALPENMSAGARITSTYGGLDLGLGYFFGWDRTPFYFIDPDLVSAIDLLASDEQFRQDFQFTDFVFRNPEFLELMTNLSDRAASGEDVFFSRYERRHTVIGDLVSYLGPIGVRFETAWSPKRTAYLDNYDSIRLPAINSALAFTWEESSSFILQVEGFYSHTFEVPPGQEIAVTGTDYYGLGGVVRFGLDRINGLAGSRLGDITLMFGGLLGVKELDFVIYPSASWAATDNISLMLGAIFFEGPDPQDVVTVGGLYEENDQFWFSFDATF